MSDNINFDIAEKFSYAYIDDKYAKIAVAAQGSGVLADPNTWSYAETHSYVKVDPNSLGISIPSGVDDVYAKVVYIPDISNAISGVLESLEKDPIFKQISGGFITRQTLDSELLLKQNLISIDSKLPYEMISGMTNIEIHNSDFDNFVVNESNISLGTLSSLSVSGNKLQVNIGIANETSGLLAYAHGKGNKALGRYSVADGYKNETYADCSHAEGQTTIANGFASHAEGEQSITGINARAAHAEGTGSNANGTGSHAEGGSTANGNGSHAEGNQTVTNAEGSHSEGFQTIADGIQSHAEGNNTNSVGSYSHAEGSKTIANGGWSHAEGDLTIANGQSSHAEGAGTIATGHAQHVEGIFNTALSGYQHIVGGGNSDNDRKNIQTLDWNGNEWIAGTLSASDFIAGSHKLSEKVSASELSSYVDFKIAEIETSDFDSSVLSAYAFKSDIPSSVSQLTNDLGFISNSDLSSYVLSADLTAITSELNTKIDNLDKPYNLSIGNGNEYFNKSNIEISSLIDANPIIVSKFESGSVSIPSSIISSSNISYNNLITKEIWIGVPSGKSVTFNSSVLSANYDLIGEIPSTLSGSTTKNYAYHIFVMRCNTKGNINAELAYSHVFNTNSEIEE